VALTRPVSVRPPVTTLSATPAVSPASGNEVTALKSMVSGMATKDPRACRVAPEEHYFPHLSYIMTGLMAYVGRASEDWTGFRMSGWRPVHSAYCLNNRQTNPGKPRCHQSPTRRRLQWNGKRTRTEMSFSRSMKAK
jgi:hypothetical protein